jgi:hypothetical protein
MEKVHLPDELMEDDLKVHSSTLRKELRVHDELMEDDLKVHSNTCAEAAVV